MLNRNLSLTASLGLLLMLPNLAWAQVFLVGAGYYSSEANGTNSALFGGGYLYSTNPNTGSFSLPLNLGGNIQGTGISFALAPGNNNFTFSVTSPLNPGSFGGLMLFFNSTGTSFNPPPGVYAGNLVAVTPTNNMEHSSFRLPAF